MGVLLMLAGFLLLVAGGASFSRQPVAARSRMRQRGRATAVVLTTLGVVCVLAGGALLLG